MCTVQKTPGLRTFLKLLLFCKTLRVSLSLLRHPRPLSLSLFLASLWQKEPHSPSGRCGMQGYSWSPKICPTTGSGRGSWSRNIAFFFTTSFHLELLLSLSLIPLSFPIPHPVPRFWQIPLSEKAKEVKSRIPSRHFASSRIPHCRSRAAEKSAAF